MKQQFKLYRRGNGRYYAEDTTTGKQSSLGTRDKAEAHRLLHARNEAAYQPAFNKQMAKTYLAAGDPRANTRTWQDVMDYLLQSKEGRSQKTRERYESAVKDPGFDSIRNLPLIHTTAETLYKVLKADHRLQSMAQAPFQRTAGRDLGRTSVAVERGKEPRTPRFP